VQHGEWGHGNGLEEIQNFEILGCRAAGQGTIIYVMMIAFISSKKWFRFLVVGSIFSNLCGFDVSVLRVYAKSQIEYVDKHLKSQLFDVYMR